MYDERMLNPSFVAAVRSLERWKRGPEYRQQLELALKRTKLDLLTESSDTIRARRLLLKVLDLSEELRSEEVSAFTGLIALSEGESRTG